ncbi:LuxR family transcriptional regulator AbsR2 [Streptomyces mexicanus]|uniref:LuxR family transcriptional regulator AbsR2 n=1 Tax=Streptomyces mexicanus TaxID=178566 RepID=UPI00369AD849
MTPYEHRDTQPLDDPWPFTGRADELDLVSRSVAAGRPGLVVTGPAGRGKTRLVLEAVRGTDWARVTGTPAARRIPLAAFAHLLPGTPTLPRALRLLSGTRLLLVDDAHLLDDASAALVHQLAVHARTRLLVVAADDTDVPEAISRLWTGELLPRLALEPLPSEDTARLVAAGAGGAVDPFTAHRLHRLCQGDLRLLRDLLGALRERGLLTYDRDTGERSWRGPLPLTDAVRDRAAPALERARAEEREALERLAFAEPLPLDADALDLRALEDLEADGLVRADERGAVRLAHPLHGPALRAATGVLRARRLAPAPRRYEPALHAEQAALARGIDRADVRDLPAPVGEWLVEHGIPVPAGYAAVRARLCRLRGEMRQALAWAREGLRAAPRDSACRTELLLAAAQCGETVPGDGTAAPGARAATWRAVTSGDLAGALRCVDPCDPASLYDAVRLGAPERAVERLGGRGPFARHADALARRDGAALDRAAEELEQRGFLLFAAEAHAQAVRLHRDPGAARSSRMRALALARRCPGARTPALGGLVLGELTARQRQIVALAAAGLSNRQIAERLTLSVRTVGNHLHSAYTRLGAGDRTALPALVAQPA